MADLERDFTWVAESFHMTWQLHDRAERIKTLLMVSQLGHCLNDLLFRWSSGSLPVDIVGVVSNHEVFRGLTESYQLPFHYIPVTKDNKPAAEAQAPVGHRRDRPPSWSSSPGTCRSSPPRSASGSRAG